jgi:hypothetical protein
MFSTDVLETLISYYCNHLTGALIHHRNYVSFYSTILFLLKQLSDKTQILIWRAQVLVARTTPVSNFLFTNLFSIKFLYFFIISSFFPYFNLFVSIFIQSYVYIKIACVDPIWCNLMLTCIRLYEYWHEQGKRDEIIKN